MANGYPIGAILTRDAIADVMSIGMYPFPFLILPSTDPCNHNAGSHGTTFGGSPLASRLGHHVLSRLSEPSFISGMNDVSKHLYNRASTLPQLFPALLQPELRGRGMILGLGFKNSADPGRLVKLARERGVLLLTAGKDAVRLVPSLNVTEAEVDVAVDVIESSLGLM